MEGGGGDRELAIKEQIEKIGLPLVEEMNVDTKLLELENNIIGTDMEIMNSKFSMEELNRAIVNCKDKSSPGMDGIEYKMIKDCVRV